MLSREKWDGTTQSIKLSSDGSVPYKDNSPVVTQSAASSPVPVSTPVSSSTTSTSKSSATLKDPVKLGETYSWSASEKASDTTASASYSFTVKKVEPITVDEITKLGFKVNTDPTKVEYVMVTAEQMVSNASILSGEQYLYLAFYRHVSGSKTPTGKSVIGVNDYGFTGSMNESAGNATKDSSGLKKKILPGQVHSYKYEGKIILPITKGEENYLSLTKDSSLDYSNRYIYFCLK